MAGGEFEFGGFGGGAAEAVTVTVKSSVSSGFTLSLAEMVAVYALTAASAATVPDTFPVVLE